MKLKKTMFNNRLAIGGIAVLAFVFNSLKRRDNAFRYMTNVMFFCESWWYICAENSGGSGGKTE